MPRIKRWLILTYKNANIKFFREKKSSAKKGSVLASIIFVTMLTSCSGKFSNGAKILEGRLDYNRKDYQGAIANFLEAYDSAKVTDDKTSQEYALFGLASTYLMQDENESAIKRFEQTLFCLLQYRNHSPQKRRLCKSRKNVQERTGN